MTPTSRGIMAAISATALLALSGCGGSKAAANTGTTSTAASNFVVIGTVSITTGDPSPQGNDCGGGLGFQDITNGAQVVVYDNAGKQLAIGALSAGATDGNGACVWPLTVAGVPAGVGPYSIQVAQRGKTAFNQADAGHVMLKLGN